MPKERPRCRAVSTVCRLQAGSYTAERRIEGRSLLAGDPGSAGEPSGNRQLVFELTGEPLPVRWGAVPVRPPLLSPEQDGPIGVEVNVAEDCIGGFVRTELVIEEAALPDETGGKERARGLGFETLDGSGE